MKRFFALIMMLCLLVQTGWAQVHATSEKAHAVLHESIGPHAGSEGAHTHLQNQLQADLSDDGFHPGEDPAQAQAAGGQDTHSIADHGGHCELSHLNVALGAPVGLPLLAAHDVPACRPSFAAHALPLSMAPDIERPKWDLATSAVASR